MTLQHNSYLQYEHPSMLNGQMAFSNQKPFPASGPAATPLWGIQRPPEVNCLSDTLSELAISDCAQPPPNKIRRRNAITIHDHPNPPVFQFQDADMSSAQLPAHHRRHQEQDAFESSFLLQRMEELQKRLGVVEMSSDGSRSFEDVSPPPPSPDPYDDDYQDFSGPVKRKIPTKNHKKEIDKISLHADLQTYKPRTDFDLPDSLLRRYRSNKCNALVLYQPPIDMVAQLKEQENNNFVSFEEKTNNSDDSNEAEMTE
jgi:hypothetical protein